MPNSNDLLPDPSMCRNCGYYRIVRTNLLALRWLTAILATLLPLLLVIADIVCQTWELDGNHVALYSVGVIGLVGIAFLGKLK